MRHFLCAAFCALCSVAGLSFMGAALGELPQTYWFKGAVHLLCAELVRHLENHLTTV